MLRAKPAIRGKSQVEADPSEASPLRAYQRAFCEWTVSRGLSANTARVREWTLDAFIRWAHERGLRQPGEVTRPVLQRYQRHLYLSRKVDGSPLALSTQLARMTPLVAWFKWLTREGHILSNPAADLELPRRVRQLPRHLLSVADAESVINQPEVSQPQGVRDRAMLEVLYSSGVRRSELIALALWDVDCERGTLMVRQGKGRRDRLIPLGARACAWVRRYLAEVRPQLLAAEEQALFLTDWGTRWEASQLSMLARRYMHQAGIAHGSCHAFRHACATHMLEGGADIRYIQAMLGHAELGTTEIYTHVAIDKLKAVHAMSHPARLERAKPAPRPTPQPYRNGVPLDLIEALEAENDEEYEV